MCYYIYLIKSNTFQLISLICFKSGQYICISEFLIHCNLYCFKSNDKYTRDVCYSVNHNYQSLTLFEERLPGPVWHFLILPCSAYCSMDSSCPLCFWNLQLKKIHNIMLYLSYNTAFLSHWYVVICYLQVYVEQNIIIKHCPCYY